MENRSDNRIVWIVLAVLAAMVLCVGCVTVGGLTAFLIARSSASQGVSRELHVEVPAPPIQIVPQPAPELEVPLTVSGAAMILSVEDDSPAQRAGLRRGDLILAVNDEDLRPGEFLADRLADFEPGDEITLTVLREADTLTIEVKLDENPDREGYPWLGVRVRDIPTMALPGRGPRRRTD